MIDIEATQGKRATASLNREFICIETQSGRGLVGRDPDGSQSLLSTDVVDEVLGLAVLESLARSRVVSIDEYPQFFNPERRKDLYAQWINRLMERYAYKSKRALFKDMMNCGIKAVEGEITLSPQHHDRLESWSRKRGDGIEDIVIPASSTPAEIGAALRSAFLRCT